MKKIFKKLYNFLSEERRNIKILFTNRLYLSFGENCLTDNILDRHKVKSFTTIYSHGRTNIEYILQIEKDKHKDFLNLEYLKYEDLNNKLVPRLKTYNKTINSYNSLHMNGFEFTHHDVIKSEALRNTFRKRIERLNKYAHRKDVIIFYHHRVNESTDINRLLDDLSELKKVYSKGKKIAQVVLFYQKKIDTPQQRNVEYTINKEIHTFIFHTLNWWEGDGPDFWAKLDDDLIKEMIDRAK